MARPAVLAALCAVVIASVADASPLRNCPSTCVCRHTLTVNKADCRDIPEWDLKASDAQVVRIAPPPHPVPPSPLILSRLDMFPKVQMLSVTNRSIVELTSGNLPTLQVLDLSNNKISRFNDRTFHHMPVLRQLNLAGNPISLKRGIPLLKSSSIRTLDLGYSGLTHIPDGSLSGIPNLTSLYLQGNPLKLQENSPLVDRVSIQELDISYCKLTKIPDHSLDNLVNLQRLYLKGNDLKTILVGVLPVNLHYLDLSANRIRDVPLSPLSALKNLTNLELAKNPVKCTCELITFLDRMSEENVISEKMIVCAEPAKYAKMPWKDIDERELCKDDETSEESSDSSADDDSSSTSVSFEKDDISYEADGPPEEENRIMSQHPLPLSLQKLLQKPTRYQNMEENSIQSDQPYPNTSDDGADHMNDPPATTVETISKSHEEAEDDLIVSSGDESYYDSGQHMTTSTEVSSEQETDAGNSELSKGPEEDDSLVVPELTDGGDEVGKMGTTTESQDKHADGEEVNGLEKTTIRVDSSSENAASHEDPNSPRDRENLEKEKEQEEDLVKAPDASLAIDDRTEAQPKSLIASEESTENPDSETFMRNEETIAMGKMMPETEKETETGGESSTKVSEAEENTEHPVILAPHSEDESSTEADTHSDPASSPSTTEEPTSPQASGDGHDENSLRSVFDEVTSVSEATEMNTKETEETTTDQKLVTAEDATTESVRYDTEESHVGTTEMQPFPETSEAETKHTTEPPKHEVQTDSEDSTTNRDAGKVIELDEPIRIPISLESSENALKNGEFESTETTQRSSEEMGVGFEPAEGHSDNETETESASSDLDSQGHLNKNAMPEIEESISETNYHELASVNEHKHSETNAVTEPVLSVTEGLATNDPSLIHDKDVPSTSPNVFADIDAQLASILTTLSSSPEYHATPDETTTPRPETTTHHTAETNTGSFGSLFPLYRIPVFSGDKDQNTVSETADHVSQPAGESDEHVSLPAESFNDHVSVPAESSSDHVSVPAESSSDHVSVPAESSSEHVSVPAESSSEHVSVPAESSSDPVSEQGLNPSEPGYDDQTVENNQARTSDSEDVVMTEDSDDVHLATMAYVVIACLIVCIIIAVACVSLRTRPDKKRKGSASVRIRGENVSPGTEMKDMMNPLLGPIAEGQTANEFHDDPTRRPSLVSLPLNGHNDKFPVVSRVPLENEGRISNGSPTQDSAYKPIPVDEPDEVTEVVIEAPAPNGGVSAPPSRNGLSAPVNGKPPRQNGTAANKVKVVAGIIPPAVMRTPVYIDKVVGES